MTILSETAFPVLSGEVVKQREPELGARFVTLKANAEAGRKAKAVEIPLMLADKVAERVANSPQFAGVVTGLVMDYQAKLIQKQLASPDVKTIYASSISIDNIIVAYEAEQLTEGRISKDKIGAWFDTALVSALTVRFADKLGIGNEPTEAEMKKLSQVVSAYRDNFTRLAARDVALTEEQKKSLSTAIGLASVDDSMKSRLSAIIADASSPEQLLGL